MVFAAIVTLLLVPANPARAETDLVLLLDLSTSMRGLFPEVREQVFQEIDTAEIGDRVVIITFGAGVHLLARRRVRGPADRAYLRALVQGLEPSQRATYLTRGLDRGFKELLGLFETAPDRDRRMIWLSDDKNNPPASLGDEVFTLADLRKQNADFKPQGEWFSFDAPMGETAAAELSEFLQWARRTLFHVEVREAGVTLGTLTAPEMTAQTTIHFVPQHGGLEGLEFLVLARVSDPTAPEAPHHDLTVEPSVVKVQAGEWEQTFTLSFTGEPGSYTGFVVFESYARTNFRVEPERIALAFAVEAPLVVAAAPEVEAVPQTLTEIAAEILEGAERPVGGARGARPLEFGPVEPGNSYQTVIQLSTNAPVSRSDLRLQTEFELPAGFELRAEFTGKDQLFRARLQLKVSSSAAVSQLALQGGAIEGRITFAADQPNIRVLPAYRRVLVKLDSRSQRWGRRLLPAEVPLTRTQAEQMTLEEIAQQQQDAVEGRTTPSRARQLMGRVLPVVRSPFLWGGMALVVVVGWLVMRFRPRETAFFGELVVIKDPHPRKMRDVSLRRAGGQSGRDALSVGSAAGSDVRLAHESVRDLHVRILAAPVGENTVMTLQPARGAEVKVNDKVRTERVRLNDKDLIAIGDYIFLFSSPEPQRRVVVRFLDGSVLRGTPLQWDIAQSDFQLLLDDPGGDEDTAHVDFADLKAVFFVQETMEGRALDRISADRFMPEFDIEVEFRDGEKIAGFALRDYTEHAPRFYLVPQDDPTVVSVLIERANTKTVVQRPRTAAATGSWLSRLFARS